MLNYTLPKEVKNILEKFKKANYRIYVVGGAVRDLLMGSASRRISDWDFTTDAKPEEILKLFPEGFYDNKFGTVGILLKEARGDSKKGSRRVAAASEASEDARRDIELAGPRAKFEITTMRKEGIYKDHRHPIEVSWTDKIEEDLARRDFTINALALTLDNVLVDPFQGQKDIENKLIKAVGDAKVRFEEDALRLMRAIRIAAQLGFSIEDQTFQAIGKNAILIKQVAWERIRDELFKLLLSDNPEIGIDKLKESGLLPIILPEVERCFGIKQEGPKHDRTYDIGEHLKLALKFTPSKNPLVKFAALLHDIGKADTQKIDSSGNVTFYNHEVVGGNLSLQIAKRFNLSNKETDKLYKLIRFHMFTVTEDQTDSAIRRFIKNVGTENIDDLMAVRIGDRLGGGTKNEVSWRMEKFKSRIKEVLKKPFSISDLKINGNDVMKKLGAKPGPKIGEILQKLFAEVLKDSSKNKREYLLDRIKNYG